MLFVFCLCIVGAHSVLHYLWVYVGNNGAPTLAALGWLGQCDDSDKEVSLGIPPGKRFRSPRV